jgi:hypothetical protein
VCYVVSRDLPVVAEAPLIVAEVVIVIVAVFVEVYVLHAGEAGTRASFRA